MDGSQLGACLMGGRVDGPLAAILAADSRRIPGNAHNSFGVQKNSGDDLRRTITLKKKAVMPVSSAQPMVLTALTPTRGQQGLALFAALLLTVTFLFAMIFASIHLPVIPTFIPIVVTITVINDVITAALLFAQFSVVRSRALLALACGYPSLAFF